MASETFRIAVPEEALTDLRERLDRSRWVDDFANADWRYGANGDYIRELVHYWRDGYDWRARERLMNGFSHYRTRIDDVPIHFIHERGRGPAPVPLILTHGWPWSFWDFHKVIGPLTDPAAHGGDPADAFDVIIPSLPGHGFSSPLYKPGVNWWETADLWARLMSELGYDRFAAGGGDWGSMVTSQLGHKYADRLIGIYLHFLIPLNAHHAGEILGMSISPDDYGPEEEGWRERTARTVAQEVGHIGIQGSKPQSIAYALNDSPIGLAAWIVDKRRNLSDCGGNVEARFTKDDLLDTVVIYWLTGTVGTAARYYYEAEHRPWVPSHGDSPVVNVPTGAGVFLNDVVLQPRRWAERYFDLRRWKVHPSGGHFAAMEEPAVLIEDIRGHFRPLRNL